MVTSRERVEAALAHRELDRVPIDLGGTVVTGMHVSTVYRMRQALALDPPGAPVKVIDPAQMLGEIDADLAAALGSDTVSLSLPHTIFGFPNSGWHPWELSDGTPVLVPEGFNTMPEADGSLYLYPRGDRSAAPSGRMPKDGYYVDVVVRQMPVDEKNLDPAENAEEFVYVTEADLSYYRAEAERLYSQTDKALILTLPGTSFGAADLVPAPWLRQPRGIRDVAEWYASTITRPDYVYRVFERQCAVAIANLEKIHAAVGERVAAVFLSGTDFGMQSGPLISPAIYRNLYQPFHAELNQWIHAHTRWRTFIHSCGAVGRLLPDFIAGGFDAYNPVQLSARGMDAGDLKRRYGEQITFWGGGVDTQHTLPFGTPDEVRLEVLERLGNFGPGGGYVFAAVHNIQPQVPVANVHALFAAAREFRLT